jgi:hypothetical protein
MQASRKDARAKGLTAHPSRNMSDSTAQRFFPISTKRVCMTMTGSDLAKLREMG